MQSSLKDNNIREDSNNTAEVDYAIIDENIDSIERCDFVGMDR
jgi:hypothetical protein